MNEQLAREYMAERAAWLHETSECDWDHDLWICKYTVAQSMAEDLLFCVKRPDPKLSAEIVAERWQTWLAERKAQQAEEYARGEQAAQNYLRELLSEHSDGRMRDLFTHLIDAVRTNRPEARAALGSLMADMAVDYLSPEIDLAADQLAERRRAA